MQVAVGRRKRIVLGLGHEIVLEHDVLGLEAIGVDVGEVVRHHVHLTLQAQLPRKRDQLRIVHRAVPVSVPETAHIPMRAASALTQQEPCQSKKAKQFRACRGFAAMFVEADGDLAAKPTRQ